MKIVLISGSPRSGNCERLLKEAAEEAKKSAEVEIILLRNLKFTGCCGRDPCYHEGFCPFKDDIQLVMKKIDEADGIIIATPSYFNNVSGLLKNFMGRTNPYCKNKKWKGKKAGLIVVGGATKRSLIRCAKTVKDFFWIHGMELIGTEYFLAEGPRETDNEKDLGHARRLARKMAKS